MNEREQLLQSVEISEILCASIRIHGKYNSLIAKVELKKNYSDEELSEFLEKFNINNESEVYSFYGTIWLKDGSWMWRDRDGWEWTAMPEIPQELI